MQLIKTCANWARRQVRRNNPEHLWMHYTLALSLIMGLFVATHFVNKTIIAHSSTAAKSMRVTNAEQIAGNDVMLAAEYFVAGGENGLERLQSAIVQLSQDHASLSQLNLWSQELQDRSFSAIAALDTHVEGFLSLAQELTEKPTQTHTLILDELSTIYSDPNFREKQLDLIALLRDEVDARGDHLYKLQRVILFVSVIALLAEAVLIFLPAQMTVKSSIIELRHKTEIMRRSKRQLAEANRQLKHLIGHDALTGLPNRTALVKHLDVLLRGNPTAQIGVLSVGLDHFKSLNDTAGHDYGDAILRAVADSFKSCIDSEDLIARIGGDEFVLVTFEPPQALAARLMNALAEPFSVMGRNQPINASIGYLALSSSGGDALSLISDAGIALQAAKNAGGNRIEAFTPRLRAEIEMIQELQQELPEAIASGQIEPWFQPQIRLSNGTVHGAEVLARWRHPVHGLMAPDKFLPAAVRAGLMIDLDHAVWQSAMKHLRDWQIAGAAIPQISLNAAPETIADPNLIERFLLLLHVSGLCTNQIIIEVLETTIINDTDDMASINIDSLAECGISLELDDFGTGYASLSKLTQLPLAGIKLDRSLVAPLPDLAADSVVRAILALAVELNLHVVAEGIEQNEQAQSLNEYGCAIGQGYGFARPMSADDFHQWLRDNQGIRQVANVGTPPFPKWA